LIYQVNVVYLALLLSAAALLISVFSLFYFRSYLKRRTSQERILSELRVEVNKILRSIDETTDRDISLIEEREKDLKALLLDIEKRLKLYMRETEKHREAEEAYTALSETAAPSTPGTAQANSDSAGPASGGRSEIIYTELGKNRFRINRQVSSQTEKSAANDDSKTMNSSAAEAGPSPAGVKPDAAFPLPNFRIKLEDSHPGEPPSVSAQIHELLRAGFAPPLIASRLNISIAEVEFAANLLERRES